MATTALIPVHGHRAKTTLQHVLMDADDNATAVVTIPVNPHVGGHIIIDEIVAGFNGVAAAKFVTVAQGALSVAYPVVSGALGVENPKLLIDESVSYLVGTTLVTITLDASGAGGTDGHIVVKWRYENER